MMSYLTARCDVIGFSIVLVCFRGNRNWKGFFFPFYWNFKNVFLSFNVVVVVILTKLTFFFPLSVHRRRGGGMVSPQPPTTLDHRWRLGQEGRGSAWAGGVPGRWSSTKTRRVLASHCATSLFTLQSQPCTPTSR